MSLAFAAAGLGAAADAFRWAASNRDILSTNLSLGSRAHWATAISFEEACDIGEEFLQDAIYYVEGDHLYVSHCDSRRVKSPISKFSQKFRPIG